MYSWWRVGAVRACGLLLATRPLASRHDHVGGQWWKIDDLDGTTHLYYKFWCRKRVLYGIFFRVYLRHNLLSPYVRIVTTYITIFNDHYSNYLHKPAIIVTSEVQNPDSNNWHFKNLFFFAGTFLKSFEVHEKSYVYIP